MKKIYFSVCLVLATLLIHAQIPAGFNYQAIIRNDSGELMKNRNIGVRFTILKGFENGAQVYSETIYPTTNINGLVTAEIGKTNSSQFSQIDWSEGIYYLKTETDLNGGSNYTISGISQLLSVPFAMYAEKSGDGLKITGTPQPGDILYNNGLSWGLLPKGANGQTLRLDNGMPKWGEPGYALPMVTTNIASDVLQTGATSGGNVIATGYSDITARGVCWSTTQNPTTADSKTTEPAGIGTYTSKLTNLLANTNYYARAYATNAAGTAYGNQVTFKTFLTVVFPTVTTLAAGNVTEYSAASGGNVTATGGAEVTAKGICWSTNQNPTIADKKTNDGTGTGQFNSQMDNLNPGYTYYVRAYATNSAGTGYGNQVSFATMKTLPLITTKNVTDISSVGGVTGGIITSIGGGIISERGICWGEAPNPTILDNKEISISTQASYSLAIVKATKPNTTYFIKSYAINELGVSYGDQKSFTTSDASYYTSFEMGITPVSWSGPWTVTNLNAFDGSYSFKSLIGQDNDAIFSTSLSNPGYLIFYYSFKDYAISLEVYLDDVKVASYPNDGSGWRQGLIEISSGYHKIKWHYVDNPGNVPFSGSPANGYCLIDHITITK
jgi:hypothetical protein